MAAYCTVYILKSICNYFFYCFGNAKVIFKGRGGGESFSLEDFSVFVSTC